ncbi:MAG: MGH1-like glycoside hydrolase domain-containing protein, partial [Povalibacter sp.]
MSSKHEKARLKAARDGTAAWKRWGPYLSERQWGTVREDYSDSGDAWNYFSHDQARSRAYRSGEDGLAGVCDDKQRLCIALALWNGVDPILKERLFGLTNSEGNHGEDVKEYYFYLDSTPTHSYLKYLYKYPQRAYPYEEIVLTNKARGRDEFEFELLDTGVFEEDRYFDVFVEYAKASPDDILIQITAFNRGPSAAPLHVLPTFWFRNTWLTPYAAERPLLWQLTTNSSGSIVGCTHPSLGERFIYAEGAAEFLFTENETNTERVFNTPNVVSYVKDGINDCVVHGLHDRVNPDMRGTKAAPHYSVVIGAGQSHTFRLRLTEAPPDQIALDRIGTAEAFGEGFDAILAARKKDADDFYGALIPKSLNPDAANVMRQALAGMLWSKQFYQYDIAEWVREHSSQRRGIPRNAHWRHMYDADIISMPDKWEYPWYAAWDLAFHILALTLVDEGFGKDQLELMLRSTYLHPNGQLPAYEWNFGDVNPPVHAWSTIFTYRLDAARRGRGDVEWLERAFHPLLLNFTWWVNRKDR